ncbi:MAG: FAD-dependent thymidylate synthase [Ruminococcus sp.]|nr:FAD-dependent thymidylate synthase [Ruminococcus sp.]
MKVKLLTYTPEPEKYIATAAKLCYANSDVDSLLDGLTEEKIDSFIDMLASIGHQSPIEHVSFTFAIEGISRACSHQLVRHRIASYSQQSQRYVSMEGFEYVTPPEIAEDEEIKALYDEQMFGIAESYRVLTDALAEKHFKTFSEQGQEEKTARRNAQKKAIEDARFVLPNACETKIVVTMNARTLLHFFKLRCCNRAQWEIRAVATEMLKQAYAAAPHLFRNAGPSCVSGACPEGKMSCGRAAEMRELFSQIKQQALDEAKAGE